MKSTITIERLRVMKREGEKIASLTAYDAGFARILNQAGVEMLLVGDSLGMVLHGEQNTLRVTVDEMVYHTRQVARGSGSSFVLADMPFMSYATPGQAMANAGRLVGEGGAHMVKLEGAAWLCDTVEQLSTRGIPVCAHLGLTPQWVNKFSGYRVQGRTPEAARVILADARSLESAGAEMLVLESVPAALAQQITGAVTMPVIGIGAGLDCDGQVLVLHDLLGITEHAPRASRNFMEGVGDIRSAVQAYVRAVKERTFPGPENSFT